MRDQKIENLLNLALSATPEEREKSLELDVGFLPELREWEVVVKYSGDIDRLKSENVTVVKLLNGYAILVVPEILISQLADIPEIEYIEKPKRLFFAVNQGRTASCMSAVQNSAYDLYGQGTLVAILDSGVDYAHPDFRNEDGTTRILNLWDQTIPGNPPEGYVIGTEYTKSQIDEALQKPTEAERMEIVPSVDVSGHGTSVLGVAAGNGRASNGVYRGVASRSELLVVKLGTPRSDSFPKTTELMQGLDYVIRKALEYQKPIAVNISFGNTYGVHLGESLLERFINDISGYWKNVICVGTGNEGLASGHAEGRLTEGRTEDVEIAIGGFESSMSIQIWKSYVDEVDVAIVSPSGVTAGPFQNFLGPQRFTIGQTELLIYYGEPSPYSTAQEIFIDMIPSDEYIESGIWTVRLIPKRIVEGVYNMWLPSAAVLSEGTRFLRPTEDASFTIPSTADQVVAVGAYNARNNTYAGFSGRGFADIRFRIRPDLVAPGVDITTTVPGGGYGVRSGTSIAAPFVTGAAALMMQWGITDGNDKFLYGEKVKAYLRKGAKPLPGFTTYPNPQVGYGALCVRDSLPL